MKEYSYKPEKNSSFEGEVIVKVPTYTERLRLIKQLNFKVDNNGEVINGPEQIDSAIKLVEVVKKYLVKVDVKSKATKEAFDTVESLEYYQEGSELINEVGNVILSGIRMSKN